MSSETEVKTFTQENCIMLKSKANLALASFNLSSAVKGQLALIQAKKLAEQIIEDTSKSKQLAHIMKQAQKIIQEANVRLG